MVLKTDYDKVKLQEVIYGVMFTNEITSPNTHHQNNVTKIFHFQAPPLAAEFWLRSWLLITYSYYS